MAPSAQATSPLMKNSPVRCLLSVINLFFLATLYEDGKLRTYQFTKTAVKTVVIAIRENRMVPLAIELV
jgi:hypothetical protein